MVRMNLNMVKGVRGKWTGMADYHLLTGKDSTKGGLLGYESIPLKFEVEEINGQQTSVICFSPFGFCSVETCFFFN